MPLMRILILPRRLRFGGDCCREWRWYYDAHSGDEARITATNPVKEGEDAIFTIARTLEAGKTASAQTVYLNTKSGTATKEDFQEQEKFAIHFKSDELTKDFVVKTEPDSVTDIDEYFFVNLLKVRTMLIKLTMQRGPRPLLLMMQPLSVLRPTIIIR